VGACHAENDNFKFWEAQQLKTRFGGNSLECSTIGSMNVYLKRHNEYYRWESLKTTVHNIIVGKIWIDHYGDSEIKNVTTGEKAGKSLLFIGLRLHSFKFYQVWLV
jgi:hypothetical protein